MRKPANILFLAIVIGLLSAAMVYRYLQAQQAALEAARNSARQITTQVIVASELIPIGSRIEARQVRSVAWPLDAQPEGAIREAERAVGSIARATIQKNQPVSESNLVSEGAGLLALIISEGMRGMSVKVDKVTGVSGFVTPNSRVDVLVSGKIEDGEDREQHSKLILQNIKVLAIGTTIEQQDDKPVEVPTVTLLVSPEDAEKLTLAARQEPVRLALRNYRDNDNVETSGVTTKQLFGLDGKRRRTAGKVGKTVPARPSVEILLGETRTRQPY